MNINRRTRMPGHLTQIINKRQLLDFLSEIKESHPMIYWVLRRLPKSVFCITADDDYRKTVETLTIEEFCATMFEFHPRQAWFSVRFNTYLFRKEWKACGAIGWGKDEVFNGVTQTECHTPDDLYEILDAYECIIAYFLREAMLKQQPFRVNDNICREYGLTVAEGEEFRELVDYSNIELLAEFHDDIKRLQGAVQAFSQK